MSTMAQRLTQVKANMPQQQGAISQLAAPATAQAARPFEPQRDPPPLPDANATREQTDKEAMTRVNAAPDIQKSRRGFWGLGPRETWTESGKPGAIAKEAGLGNLSLNALASMTDAERKAAYRGYGTMQQNEAAENAFLGAQSRRVQERALGNYANAVDTADLTTDDYRRQQDIAAQDAAIYDPRSEQAQTVREGQGSIYSRLLGTALGDGPTAGETRLQAQLARGENQAKMTAMQAALAGGASPAAAARAATMASENYTRGTASEIAATGMAERLANMQAAAGMGESQQQITANEYARMRAMELGALESEKAMSASIMGVPYAQNVGMTNLGQNQQQINISKEALAEQKAQNKRNFGLGIAGAILSGGGSLLA